MKRKPTLKVPSPGSRVQSPESRVPSLEAHAGLSFDQIRSLVQAAIEATYPPVNVTDEDASWAYRYSIRQIWPDRVLVHKSYRWSRESDPKHGLIKFTLVEDADAPQVQLGALIPMQIQAVSTDGKESLVLDESSQ